MGINEINNKSKRQDAQTARNAEVVKNVHSETNGVSDIKVAQIHNAGEAREAFIVNANAKEQSNESSTKKTSKNVAVDRAWVNEGTQKDSASNAIKNLSEVALNQRTNQNIAFSKNTGGTNLAKKLWIIVFAIVGGVVAVLITATFVDLKLSEAMYMGDNAFTAVFSSFGKAPAYLFVSFAAGVMFLLMQNTPKSTKVLSVRNLLLAVYIFGTLGATSLFALSLIIDLIEGKVAYLIAISGGIAMGIFLLCAMKKIKIETLKNLKKWSILSIFIVSTILVFVFIIKLFWGRARYADILLGEGAVFTPWYKICGFTGNVSMPSGHTSLALCCVLAIPLIFIVTKNKLKTAITAVLSVLFVLLVILSRIAGGEHFLSDTMVSLLISIAISVFYVIMFYGKGLQRRTIVEGSFFDKL